MKLFISPFPLLQTQDSHELGACESTDKTQRVLKDGSSEQPNLPTPLLDEKAPIDIISSGKYLQWKKLHFCSDGEWEPEHSNSSLFIF